MNNQVDIISKLNVLYLEDSFRDFEIIRELLISSGFDLNIDRAENEKEFISNLQNHQYNVILADFKLPRYDAFTALYKSAELCPDIPFIVVSGTIGEETAIEIIKQGAVDYVLKDRPGRLPSAIKRALKEAVINKERILSEELIMKERIMLRTLIDNLPAPVYILDKEARKVVGNRADIENIGYKTEAEIIGKNDIELFPGETGIRGHSDNLSVIKTGIPIVNREENFINKEGIQRWLLTSKYPLHDIHGSITGLVGLGHDITERKKNQEALVESYEFSNSLLKTIPFGMHIVDETGNVLFQSENFTHVFGPDAIGKKCWDLVRDDKKQCAACPILSGIETGVTKNHESYGVMGGRIYLISHTGMMFRGKLANLEIFQDITDRKLSEIELGIAKKKAEESDKLKTAFLNNISHEIRTPLNAIVGFAALLSAPDMTKELQESFIQTINQSSDHLLAIVSDIVEFSNIEAGILKTNKYEINLDEVLNEVYKQFIKITDEKGLQLILDLSQFSEGINIKIDKTKMVQILSNLLSNAIKFTADGVIEFGYALKEKYIEFYVSDTGIGIPQDQLTRIFDRFYQVEHSEARLYEGTGLGLSICKAYVEFMGGKIWLISKPGKGAKFFFTIPFDYVEKSDISNNFPDVKKISITETNTILVAEDDDTNFRLVKEILSIPNIKIIRAKNGRESIELCKSDPDIRLVLMDIKMPGMDGFEASKQIKSFLPDLPLIALTAYSSDIDRNKALFNGFTDFITKPFSIDLLISKVKEQLFKK